MAIRLQASFLPCVRLCCVVVCVGRRSHHDRRLKKGQVCFASPSPLRFFFFFGGGGGGGGDSSVVVPAEQQLSHEALRLGWERRDPRSWRRVRVVDATRKACNSTAGSPSLHYDCNPALKDGSQSMTSSTYFSWYILSIIFLCLVGRFSATLFLLWVQCVVNVAFAYLALLFYGRSSEKGSEVGGGGGVSPARLGSRLDSILLRL